MVKVIFVDHAGGHHETEGAVGSSVMHVAVANNIPGIDGDCGGMCACATCHITVDAAWADKTGERSELEESMLTFLPDVSSAARLGCQIKLTPELDGLTVHLPIEQF
ncbi:2Fe-2S iron-sulfur cluster-binding protein [Rhizobium binxianense]